MDATTTTRHKGLLRSRTASGDTQTAIDTWYRAAVERGQRICTVGTLPLTGTAAARETALDPADLHPSAEPARLVQRALGDGYQGLGVLIHADEVIATTSERFHDAVETALTDLCTDHPVEVLCVYDRPGVGTDCLDLAVEHHEGDLREEQLTVRRTTDVVHVAGEVDMTNLDVLDTALRATALARGRRLRIDLSEATFLSAGAAHVLHRHAAVLRQAGAHVELHGAAPPVARALQLVELSLRSPG
ncbi:STAS domain-containing protein [Pseudonocardia humida]|uniref:STAS domain-containing protein n=1 Tax=Pseudonocardia humida TaxID=2800819 RepID=A0ABT1A0F5_9PSEU|nr:STAS domain-containing protein [Pseudonocardia humida]MCO1656369.1 STAS domain-containing protein [Pseudonocardia humida]